MTEALSEITNEQTDRVTTILIVDDHPLVRDALKNLIEKRTDMKVIGEASNGEEAITLAEKLLPNIVIMDIGMPVMNGLEATQRIKARHPGIAILVLTVHTDKEHILGILRAGAAGYLPKVVLSEDIIYAINAISAGEAVLTKSVLQKILGSFEQENEIITPAFAKFKLTSRDISILKLAAKGLSNKNIASELNLAESSIKKYLTEIFLKMNVSSRTEAVISGLKTGFITLGDLD